MKDNAGGIIFQNLFSTDKPEQKATVREVSNSPRSKQQPGRKAINGTKSKNVGIGEGVAPEKAVG